MIAAIMPAVGIVLVLASVRLRAGGKLNVDFCALWGVAGMLLLFAEVLPPVRAFLGGLEPGAAWGLLGCGIFLLCLGLWGSIKLSFLWEQRQERRMEQTLRRDDKN